MSKSWGFKLVVAAVVALCAFAVSHRAVQAQMITVTREYRVAGVDSAHSRIRVSNVDSKDIDKADAGSVIVAPDTKIFVLNQALPTFSWKLLQRGMKITVKGGYTWDLHVKAREIYI